MFDENNLVHSIVRDIVIWWKSTQDLDGPLLVWPRERMDGRYLIYQHAECPDITCECPSLTLLQ